MKLAEKIFEHYRNKMTGDDEDIDILAYSFLNKLSHKDMLAIVNDLDEQELYDLIAGYLMDNLKEKFAQE